MRKTLITLSYILCVLLFFPLLGFIVYKFELLGIYIIFGVVNLFVFYQIFRYWMSLFPNETRMKAALMILSSIFGGSLILGLNLVVLFKFGFLYFCIILGITMLFIAVPIFRCKTPLFRFEKTWWWRQN